MTGKKRLFLNWGSGLLLVLVAFYSAVAWLWRAAEDSAAAALKDQVITALAGDLAEGNLFKLGFTLDKLNGDGRIRFAEIRQIKGGSSESIYKTSGPEDGAEAAFGGLACSGGARLTRFSDGVGVATLLPAALAGADCTALFISSDLPADLKALKRRVTLSFGAIISGLMLFVLWLTLSWHKKALALEVAAKTALAEKEAAIGRLAAQVAHDIRSPLAALGAAAKGLSADAQQRQLIEGAVGRMQGIADDLLKRYRSPGAAEQPPAKPAVMQLAGLVEQVVEEKRLQHAGKAGVKINFESAGGDLKAAVEAKELQRAVSNLVNNAVEAFEKGGTVLVKVFALDGQVVIEVKDDGKGIPADILAKLGKKGETHGKTGGTGLGLYHAKTSTESWGGSLKIGSEPGKGTSITMALPRAGASDNAHKAVVLLDDDMLVHMNWRMAARAAGAELKAFRTPEDLSAGLEGLPKNIPIYVDAELGDGVRGDEVAQGLREKGFTDITMATGHAPDKFTGLPWLKVRGKEPPWGQV